MSGDKTAEWKSSAKLSAYSAIAGLPLLVMNIDCLGILQRYRRGQLGEYDRRYRENWRDAFLKINRVNYKPSSEINAFL